MPNHKEELFQIGSDALDAISKEEVDATADALREMGAFKLPFPSISICVPAYDFISVTNNEGVPIQGEFQGHMFKDGKPLYLVKDTWILATHVTEDLINLTKTIDESNCQFYWIWPDGQSTILQREAFAKGQWPKEPIEIGDDTYSLHPRKGITFDAFCHASIINMASCLIVLLATRNAYKERAENKLARLGIGGKKNILKRYTYTTHISVPRPEDLPLDPHNPPTGQARRPHLRRGHIRHQHHGPRNLMVKVVWIEPVFVNADPQFVSTRTAYNLSRPQEALCP